MHSARAWAPCPRTLWVVSHPSRSRSRGRSEKCGSMVHRQHRSRSPPLYLVCRVSRGVLCSVCVCCFFAAVLKSSTDQVPSAGFSATLQFIFTWRADDMTEDAPVTSLGEDAPAWFRLSCRAGLAVSPHSVDTQPPGKRQTHSQSSVTPVTVSVLTCCDCCVMRCNGKHTEQQ